MIFGILSIFSRKEMTNGSEQAIAEFIIQRLVFSCNSNYSNYFHQILLLLLLFSSNTFILFQIQTYFRVLDNRTKWLQKILNRYHRLLLHYRRWRICSRCSNLLAGSMRNVIGMILLSTASFTSYHQHHLLLIHSILYFLSSASFTSYHQHPLLLIHSILYFLSTASFTSYPQHPLLLIALALLGSHHLPHDVGRTTVHQSGTTHLKFQTLMNATSTFVHITIEVTSSRFENYLSKFLICT